MDISGNIGGIFDQKSMGEELIKKLQKLIEILRKTLRNDKISILWKNNIYYIYYRFILKL